MTISKTFLIIAIFYAFGSGLAVATLIFACKFFIFNNNQEKVFTEKLHSDNILITANKNNNVSKVFLVENQSIIAFTEAVWFDDYISAFRFISEDKHIKFGYEFVIIACDHHPLMQINSNNCLKPIKTDIIINGNLFLDSKYAKNAKKYNINPVPFDIIKEKKSS